MSRGPTAALDIMNSLGAVGKTTINGYSVLALVIIVSSLIYVCILCMQYVCMNVILMLLIRLCCLPALRLTSSRAVPPGA